MTFEAPVAFYFKVKLFPCNSKSKKILGTDNSDTSFTEVSGISTSLEIEKNCVPVFQSIKYENLKLKRGFTPRNSMFANWCKINLWENHSFTIVTSDLQVSLLKDDGAPFFSWYFFNAYPVKWNMDSFNSTENKLAFENIEIHYDGFKRNN